ncbi:MAG: hypothetical protein V1870_05015 [Candidatus Aenigmatarchaeota archaeon]
MVKHRKQKCTSSAHVSGGHITVKGSCPVKTGRTKVVRVKARKTKHTDVPPQCKGLKKKTRRACAKRVCAQRPAEYRGACRKAAGL